MRLRELFEQGYGADLDLNCAERMVHGASKAYGLDIGPDSLKLAGAFGGGMAIESTCGALTGALMVLGRVLVADRAHATPELKPATQKYFAAFAKKLGGIDCTPLKQMYRTEEAGCSSIIKTAAEALDELMIELGYLDGASGEWKGA